MNRGQQFAVLSEKGAVAALTGMATAADVIQRAATYEKRIHEPAGCHTLDERTIQPFVNCLISTYQRVFRMFEEKQNESVLVRFLECW